MRALLLFALSGAAGVVVWLLLPPGEAASGPEEQFRAALEAREHGDPSLLQPAIRALQNDPAYADHLRVLSAVLDLSRQRFDRAFQQLDALPPQSPLRPLILQFRGESLYWMERLTEAEAVFRTLATEDPESAPAHRWLGAIYYTLGAYEASIAELTALIELTPDDYHPHRLIGLMNWDFERYAEAIPHYERVLELDPPETVAGEVRVELARSLATLRRYEPALEILAGAPDSAAAQVVAAQCHWNLTRPDEARRLLTSARQLDPTIREAYLLEADIRSADDDLEGALGVMRDAVAAHPHDAECRYRLALLLEQTGRSGESAAEMAAYEENRALATRLTELNYQALHEPRNAEIRDEIADLCEKLGKVELARTWRQAAAACRAAAELFVAPDAEPVASPDAAPVE